MGRNVPLYLRLATEDTEDFPQTITSLSLEAFMILRQLCLAIAEIPNFAIASTQVSGSSAQFN
jgi:hypothetical protein